MLRSLFIGRSAARPWRWLRLVLGVATASTLAGAAPGSALDERSWLLELDDPQHAVISIQNRDLATAVVEPAALNGRGVFRDLAEIQAEIDALPWQPPSDGLGTRILRFVADNRQHGLALTTNFDWLLTPTLFFNSMGVAACGEASDSIFYLARSRGLPARVWGLEGHVVAEVFDGGRWQMLDGDYGVYFLNRAGRVASVAELEADPTLITDPLLRMETRGWWSPYTSGYAAYFSTVDDNHLAEAPPTTQPPRVVSFELPPGASLRFPALASVAPPDWQTREPLFDYSDAVLRLPAGFTGVINNPLIVHTLRGAGTVEVQGVSYRIGSRQLEIKIDARSSALPTMRILTSSSPIEILYLVNPVRWQLAPLSRLTLRVTAGAQLDVRALATGSAGADSDGDGVFDDGGANGIVGDQPCSGGATLACDDDCPFTPNAAQLDADADARGNACDGDFDDDELLTELDVQTLASCQAHGAPADDPLCRESDLDENGRVDAADEARFLTLVAEAGGLADPPPPLPPPPPPLPPACGIGPELVLILLVLRAASPELPSTASA